MMTMSAAVLGALPLILAHGAGAESRLAFGWVIIGGLGFATLFTLFLIARRLSHPGAVLKTSRRGDAATDRRTPGGSALAATAACS